MSSKELMLTIERIMRQTTEAKLPQMMQNLSQNIDLIKNGKNAVDLEKHKDTPAIVVGAGPSLQKNKHLRLLKKAKWKHTIVACDKMLIPMLKNRIIPDYVGSVDGHVAISKFYEGKLVKKHADHIKAVMPVTIHHKTATNWLDAGGELYWYVPRMDDLAVQQWMSLTKGLHFLCLKTILVTGGNCGSFCWNLAFYLFHNPIILIGMDLSYDTMNRKKTTYYNALMRYYKNNEEEVNKAIKEGYNPIWKKRYLIDPVFETYRAFMLNYINTVNITTVNCTGGGSLFGGKILCASFKEILRQYKN